MITIEIISTRTDESTMNEAWMKKASDAGDPYESVKRLEIGALPFGVIRAVFASLCFANLCKLGGESLGPLIHSHHQVFLFMVSYTAFQGATHEIPRSKGRCSRR